MEAYITDHGDPSVGIFPTTCTVECPFTKENIDLDELKQRLFELYRDFSGRFTMTVVLEDEMEAQDEEPSSSRAYWNGEHWMTHSV